MRKTRTGKITKYDHSNLFVHDASKPLASTRKVTDVYLISLYDSPQKLLISGERTLFNKSLEVIQDFIDHNLDAKLQAQPIFMAEAYVK